MSTSLNAPYGDPLTEKNNECVRIAGQNINGFNSEARALNVALMTRELRKHQIDIFGAIETNTNWRLARLRAEVRGATLTESKEARITYTDTPMQTSTTKLPGGCAIFSLGGVVHRLTDKGSDPGGRWAWETVAGSGNANLTVITSYRTVQASITTAGPTTVYSQLWHWHFKKDQKDCDPRREHFKDLATFVNQRLTGENSHVLLLIDANEGIEGDHLEQFLIATNLIDLYGHCHSDLHDFATHNRGRHRIDFMLGSAGLIPQIERVGYAPFGMGVIGADHRLMHIDLRLKELLQTSIPTSIGRPQRIVVGRDPTSVDTYRTACHMKLMEHNCFDRLTTLMESQEPREKTIPRWRQLHEDVTRACLAAEKTMKRRHANPWSPLLIRARDELVYWQLWWTESNTQRSYKIQRDAIWGEDEPPPVTSPTRGQIKEHLKSARARLREIMSKSAEIRSAFLQQQADKRATYTGLTAAQEIKNLDRAERSRASYQRIRQALQRSKGAGLKHVLLSDDQGGHRSVTNAEEVERVILARNKKHFSQAEGTPFTTATMVAAMGLSATTPVAQSILDPKVDTSAVEQVLAAQDRATLDILAYLKRPIDMSSIPIEISVSEFARGIERWRETTSTSPSGVHLGHYKALVKWLPDDEEKLNQIHDMLSLRTGLLNAAFRLGFAYDRWQEIHSAMLEKIPGLPLVDKLRVIHIFEADMNLSLGLLWGRRLMQESEARNSLNPEQWGSRAGKSAVAAAAMKYFAYSTSRLSGVDLATFDNDAKACYDRIIILLSMLRSQMLGMPAGPCQAVAEICQGARYHIKTALRVSAESYQSDASVQLHGNGQGRRDSPAVWTYLSTMGLDLMRGYGQGMKFCDVDMVTSVLVTMIAFVDDKTVWANDFDGQVANRPGAEEHDHRSLHASLAGSAQRWAELLHAMGGKLELPKCFYYIMRCTISSDGQPRFTPEQGDSDPLTITDPAGTRIPIQQRATAEYHKTLGVEMNPEGGQKGEEKALLRKCRVFARHIRAATNLAARDVRTLHDQYFIPSVGYSLTLASLPKKVLDSQHSSVLQGLLPRAGFNRNTPRAVVHAPKYLGGLDWRPLYVHQGLQQVSLLLQHLRHDGELGQLLRIWISWLRQWAGTSVCPLANPATPFHHLLDPFVVSVRKFLSESQLAIVDTEWKPPEGQHIMDVVHTLHMSPSEVARVNAVRIHLRVTLMSDLWSADGTRRYHGISRDGLPSGSTQLWPRVDTPKAPAVRAWRKFLRATQDGPSSRVYGSDTDLRRWTFRFYPAALLVHRPNEGAWFSVQQQSRFVWRLIPTHEQTSGPSVPIDGIPGQEFLVRSLPESRWMKHRALPRVQPRWRPFEYPEVELHPDLDITAFLNKLVVVTDGGVREGRGSVGWVIASDREILARGHGRAIGHPMTSFRAEAVARWTALRWLRRYLLSAGLEWRILQMQVLSYTDSESLLKVEKRLLQPWFRWTPTHTLKGDFDVMSLLIDELREFGDRLQSGHVKGHQDRQRPSSELTWPERLNCEADRLATLALADKRPLCNYVLPGMRYYLATTDTRTLMTSDELRLLRTRKAELDYTEYIATKLPGGSDTLITVDWDALRLAHAKFSKQHHSFAVKWKHGWLPTNARLHEIDSNVTPCCVACGRIEDQEHLWRCPERADQVQDMIESIHCELEHDSTTPASYHEFLHCIETWALGGEDLPQVEGSQLRISHALRGFVHVELARPFTAEDRRDDPRRPPSRLIESLWDCSYQLWLARNSQQHAKDLADADDRDRLQALSRALHWFDMLATHPYPHKCARKVLRPSYNQLQKRRTRDIIEWVQARAETIPFLFPSVSTHEAADHPAPDVPPAPGEVPNVLDPTLERRDESFDAQ